MLRGLHEKAKASVYQHYSGMAVPPSDMQDHFALFAGQTSVIARNSRQVPFNATPEIRGGAASRAHNITDGATAWGSSSQRPIDSSSHDNILPETLYPWGNRSSEDHQDEIPRAATIKSANEGSFALGDEILPTMDAMDHRWRAFLAESGIPNF